MKFRIGTREYVVRRRYSLTLDGERVDGFCASTTRTIWLDGSLSDEVLAGVLRHEHSHAWEFEVGSPRTHEDLANFTSTVGDAFDEAFQQQGGTSALCQIPIEGLRPAGSPRAPLNPSNVHDRVACGRCSAEIMAGSVFTDTPKAHETTGIFIVDRGFRCAVCDAVQTWEERCTPDGLPLGNYFNVRLLTGEMATEWIALHQDLHSPYNVA